MSKDSVSLSLLIILLHLLLVSGELTTITVNSKGKNSPSCVANQQSSCKTLDYVLNQISVTNLTEDVMIIVEYSHTIKSVNISYTYQLNVTILGVSEPIVFCEERGYIQLRAINGAVMSIQINGLILHGFEGYWDTYQDEQITGFTFIDINCVTMSRVQVINSSDIVIIRSKETVINHSVFNDNHYHTGMLYFPFIDNIREQPTPTISTVTIQYSIFHNNYGLLVTTQIQPSAVGAYIATNNSQFEFQLSILGCVFENNYIVGIPHFSGAIYKQVSDIAVTVSSGKPNAVEFMISNSTFQHSQANYGKSVTVASFGSLIHNLYISFLYNTFYNNSLNAYGYLVEIYLSDLPTTSNFINFRYNNFTQNTHELAIVIEYFNVSWPGTVDLESNTFDSNNGAVVSISCDRCNSGQQPNINAKYLSVLYNVIPLTNSGIMQVANSNLFLLNCTFIGNVGTALYMDTVNVHVSGEVNFTGNAGKKGGGVAMYGATTIDADGPTLMVFIDNLALYGGAIYVGIPYKDDHEGCDFILTECEVYFLIRGNNASSSGDTTFINDPRIAYCMTNYLYKCFNISTYANSSLGLGSSPQQILPFYGDNGNGLLTIFPGQNIPINTTVVDAFGELGSCVATVYLRCYDQVISCEQDGETIQLQGPTEVSLSFSSFISDLVLLASSGTNSTSLKAATLHFECYYTNQAILYLNITSCPLGFVYNQTTCSCECAWKSRSGFLCSLREGKACVAAGYWFGTVKDSTGDVNVLAHCRYLFCSHNSQPCPQTIGEQSSDYVLLASTENGQCANNRGGLMCKSCRDDASFSFEAIQCIPADKCKPWQPYIILFLVITFQLLLSIAIKVAINLQMESGVGFLYGPLFYLAVINHLPFVYFKEYYQLKVVISIFTSVFLLNMEVFGQIPWCFFPNLTSLENYGFHYLGPLIVGIVLIITVFMARRCPRVQQHLSVSPLQTICLLLLLSFWSLADTSIRILQFTDFAGADQLVVELQPGLPYFTGVHIPLGILALLVMLLLVIPFVLLLLLSPFLARRVNLSRIKPLLDQFQSSYGDNYRWYPAVYMIGWMIISTTGSIILVTQIILALMASIHFLLQPYSNKWLNTANTLLLFDIILLTALVNEQNNPFYDYTQKYWVKPLYVFFIYLLVILPLLYIIIGGFYIVLRRSKLITAIKQRILRKYSERQGYLQSVAFEQNNGIQKSASTERRVSHQVIQMTESTQEYREPLLVLLPEEEQRLDYGTSED